MRAFIELRFGFDFALEGFAAGHTFDRDAAAAERPHAFDFVRGGAGAPAEREDGEEDDGERRECSASEWTNVHRRNIKHFSGERAAWLKNLLVIPPHIYS